MPSSFAYVFCCCRRQRPPKESHDTPNAVTPIFSTDIEAPAVVTYGATNVDNHRARERQNVIVRSKEGKMVNVLSRVPFNLRSDPGHASSSRSHRSTSATLDRPVDQNGRETSRTSSPKRSPPLSRSESASSVQQASLSRVSTADDLFEREPILNVKLIKSSKSSARALSRRGRSRTRQSRFADDDGIDDAAPLLEGIQSVDSGRATFHVGDDGMNADGNATETAITSTAPEKPVVSALSDEDDTAIRALSDEIASSLQDGFKIQDVGSIARGWGD